MKSLSIAAKDTHADEHVWLLQCRRPDEYWGKIGRVSGRILGLLFGSALFAIRYRPSACGWTVGRMIVAGLEARGVAA